MDETPPPSDRPPSDRPAGDTPPTPPSSTPPPLVPADETPSPKRELVVAAEPLTREELSTSLTRPHRMVDVVLGERHRLSANVRTGAELRSVVTTLLICSTLFSLPFALIDGWSRILHVAALFLGSVLLCFPSFLVFASYLGVKLHAAQSLTIALIIPAAAAVFTLGFAPIYWFLDVTMPEDGVLGGVAVRVGLLVISLALGLSHVNRVLFADKSMKALRDNIALWLGWQVLLIFLSYRMALTLGLLT